MADRKIGPAKVSPTGEIRLEQVLHGYKQGHQLVESSIALSKASQQEMLGLTDLSGSGSDPSFRSYLTAYPLISDDLYAIGRTWLATGSSRPGTVWTHTLLCPTSNIHSLNDLSSLETLFREPSGDSDLSEESYSEPVILAPSPTNESTQFKDREFLAVASDVYGQLFQDLATESGSVVIAAESPDEAQRLIIDVWANLWSSYRARFRFCTGSLSPRTAIDGTPFDLEIMPKRRARSIASGTKSTIRIVEYDAPREIGAPDWFYPLFGSRNSTKNQSFQSFTARYSVDVPAEASSFAGLAAILECLLTSTSSDSMPNLARTVADCFPDRQHALALKFALFGPNTERTAVPFDVHDIDVLAALMSPRIRRAFDPEQLEIESRAARALDEWPNKALEVLISASKPGSNALHRLFVRGLLRNIDASQAAYVLDHRPGLMEEMISQNPSLAVPLLASDIGDDLGVRLINALPKRIGGDLLSRITVAAMQSIASVAPDALLQKYAQVGMFAILDTISTYSSNDAVAVIARDCLATDDRVRDAIQWIVQRDQQDLQVLEAIINNLDPLSEPVQEVGSDAWINVLDDHMGSPSVSLFAMRLGLSGIGGQSYVLASRSYDEVERRLLGIEVEWEVLSQLAPSLGKAKNQRPLQLPNGLRLSSLDATIARRFVNGDWPRDVLLGFHAHRDSFARTVELMSESRAGRKSLGSVAEDHLSATPTGGPRDLNDRLSLLRSYLRGDQESKR